ncbi:hypothetical protein ABG067_003843 [Albugo candida]
MSDGDSFIFQFRPAEQRMKAPPMKSYALLGIGSFLMHHQLVNSLEGLRLRIHPKLDFDSGAKIPKSVKNDKWYFVGIEDPSSLPDMKPIHHLDDHWEFCRLDASSKRTQSKRRAKSLRPKVKENLTEPLLWDTASSDENPPIKSLTIEFDQWKDAAEIMGTTNGGTYVICWRLLGSDLIKWFEKKQLYFHNKFLYLSIEFFLKGFRGKHYLKWVKPNVYEIYDAQNYVEGVTGVVGEFTANVEFYMLPASQNQNIRIDAVLKAIRMPIVKYDIMRTRFPKSFFHGTKGPPNGKCSDLDRLLSSSENKKQSLDITISILRYGVIKINTQELIQREGDVCTILIEGSEDDSWVLGTLLFADFIIDNTRGSGNVMYHFLGPSLRTDLAVEY